MSDPCFVVRIAIALAALKHKPRDQSIASYLLDLQSRFPAVTQVNGSRDWRTYALELEKQLATLKAERDADQELLSKVPAEVASTSDRPPPKKKSKKNPSKDQHDPEWSWDQSRTDWSRFLSSQYPSSPSLVAAYTSLKGALAAPKADLLLFATRLTDAILRALDAIHPFLFSSPNSSSESISLAGAPLQLRPEHIDSARIALASPLLVYVLRTALHALLRTAQDSTKSKRPRLRPRTTTPATTDAHAYVDKVLDHLLEYILLPLLRAIAPLCSAHLAPLVAAPKKDKTSRPVGKGKGKDKDKEKDIGKYTISTLVDAPKKTDVRTDVFALIGTLLEALNALPPPLISPPGADSGGVDNIAGGIKDRLGLEAIRELEALYAVPSPSVPPSTLQPSSQQPPLTLLSVPSSSALLFQPRSRTRVAAEPSSRTRRLERLAGTRAERVRALATRDAGWFLASTLGLCVVAGRTDYPGGVLREALLERIGKLVRSVAEPFGGPSARTGTSDLDGADQDPSASDMPDGRAIDPRNATDAKPLLDPVCQNMLLAICERAMSHLASP